MGMKLSHIVLPVLLFGLSFADIAPYDNGCCSTGFIMGLVVAAVAVQEFRK